MPSGSTNPKRSPPRLPRTQTQPVSTWLTPSDVFCPVATDPYGQPRPHQRKAQCDRVLASRGQVDLAVAIAGTRCRHNGRGSVAACHARRWRFPRDLVTVGIISNRAVFSRHSCPNPSNLYEAPLLPTLVMLSRPLQCKRRGLPHSETSIAPDEFDRARRRQDAP